MIEIDIKNAYNINKNQEWCDNTFLYNEFEEIVDIITNNIDIQRNLILEFIVRNETISKTSINFNYLISRDNSKRILEALKTIYSTIIPIRSAEGSMIGYRVVESKKSAMDAVELLYKGNCLNKCLTSMLDLSSTHKYKNTCAFELERISIFSIRKMAAKEDEDIVFGLVQDEIERFGESWLFTNHYDAGEIENSSLIQRLICSEYKVIVIAYANEEIMNIMIRK